MRLGWRVVLVLGVAAGVAPSAAMGAFPGSNGNLVFTRFDRNLETSLNIIQLAGGPTERLPGPSRSDAAFSPDGRSLVLVQEPRREASGIFVLDLDTKRARRVTTGDDSSPAWSPDGSQIVFARSRDLYVVAADGTRVVQLTSTDVQEDSPVWSPDGSAIAFHVWRATRSGSHADQIFVVAPDGTDYRPLIPREQGISSMPDWSPDAARLVFSGGRLAHRTIRIVNRDGTGLTLLTQQSRGDDTWPHWSPDGNLIVFSRTRPKTQRRSLYTMVTDGSDLRRLTGTDGDDIVDDWQPLPFVAALARRS